MLQITAPDFASYKDVPDYIPQLLVVGTVVTGTYTCMHMHVHVHDIHVHVPVHDIHVHVHVHDIHVHVFMNKSKATTP